MKWRGGRYSVHGLIAATVVVVGAAVAWWSLSDSRGRGATRLVEATAPKLIKEVTPSAASAVKDAEAPRELTEDEKRQKKISDIEKLWAGKEMPPGLKTYVYFLKNPPKKIYGGDDRYGYLKHHSEKQLASFMTIEPGTYFIQCPEFGEEFDSDFVAAMRENIVVDPKDPPEVRVMKQAVIDVKNEVADACRKEDKLPSQILSEHAMSLFELGKYQENMRQQLNEIYNSPKYTDADVKDFCTAANMMLKDNGLQPLPYPDLTERTLELQYNLKHAEDGMRDEGENDE